MKAERVPRWQFRRLNAEQQQAFDRLRWNNPGPADRARLKLVLGWKRTREESLALARELEAKGRGQKAIADELGVTDRHLRRLLAEPVSAGSGKAKNSPAIAVPMRPPADTTCETEGVAQPQGRRPPVAGFATFADLDQWLGEQ